MKRKVFNFVDIKAVITGFALGFFIGLLFGLALGAVIRDFWAGVAIGVAGLGTPLALLFTRRIRKKRMMQD